MHASNAHAGTSRQLTWQTMFSLLVQDVLTPAVPHAEQVSHGALPERENVEPATHAMWHTVLAVLMHAVFTPAVHVESAAHIAHGATPDADHVDPATHAT